MTDLELLQRYAETRDERAFAQLVARHAGWMSAAARRRVHDPQAADDVVQAAFVLLARKASSLRGETVLSAWLFRALHYACLATLRTERLRKHHEQQAAAMVAHTRAAADPSNSDDAQTWAQLAPQLDGVVNKLGGDDRRALLLRFYERKTFPEVGTA